MHVRAENCEYEQKIASTSKFFFMEQIFTIIAIANTTMLLKRQNGGSFAFDPISPLLLQLAAVSDMVTAIIVEVPSNGTVLIIYKLEHNTALDR